MWGVRTESLQLTPEPRVSGGGDAGPWSVMCYHCTMGVCRGEVDIVFYSFQCIYSSNGYDVDVGKWISDVHQNYHSALVPSVPGPAGYHCATLGQFTRPSPDWQPSWSDDSHYYVTITWFSTNHPNSLNGNWISLMEHGATKLDTAVDSMRTDYLGRIFLAMRGI